MASSSVDPAFSIALPKAELHAHLSGSISPTTLHEIWLKKRSEGQCLDLEDPLAAIKAGGDGFVDIVSFFPLFDKYIYALCNDLENVKYATEKVLQDFSKDGVRYLELRTTPRACVETGMTKELYVDTVNETFARWNHNHTGQLEAYPILSIDRRMSAEEAIEVVDLAVKYQYHPNQDKGGYVVGVDLGGNPMKGNVSIFTEAMATAKANGLGITIHFAEVPQSSTEEELNTILSWRPDRLGHCIHVPPLIEKVMRQRSTGLEMCLSCNVLSGLTSGGFERHHIKQWAQSDCPIALSTDDVGIFGSPLSNEYSLAAKYLHLSRKQVISLAKQAVQASFAGRKRMMRLLDEFEAAFDQDG
ncbi:uncharacterized protein LTR77_011032 [Saxophila tyrrhenica]|uniref:Adenosine deaminase domain-containing protein n=1 Tax=Saxophila tyrrhenica TaxID=1690608 RepID=A0AAV9NTQ6_9PEZI|nr:hypothetical protein LTR77_011032 [Saxophila tyrrhenica]